MEEFKYVVENSQYVKINYDKIVEFVHNLDFFNYITNF